MWIRAANWLGPRGSSLRVSRAGRAVNDTAQKARAVTGASIEATNDSGRRR